MTGRIPIRSALSVVVGPGELLGRVSTPSQAMIRAESQIQLQSALNGMDPLDREIIALRPKVQGKKPTEGGKGSSVREWLYAASLRHVAQAISPRVPR